MFLASCPNDVIIQICIDWLMLDNVKCLDSAVCNHLHRPQILSIFALSDFTWHKCDPPSWLLTKGIRLRNLLFGDKSFTQIELNFCVLENKDQFLGSVECISSKSCKDYLSLLLLTKLINGCVNLTHLVLYKLELETLVNINDGVFTRLTHFRVESFDNSPQFSKYLSFAMSSCDKLIELVLKSTTQVLCEKNLIDIVSNNKLTLKKLFIYLPASECSQLLCNVLTQCVNVRMIHLVMCNFSCIQSFIKLLDCMDSLNQLALYRHCDDNYFEIGGGIEYVPQKSNVGHTLKLIGYTTVQQKPGFFTTDDYISAIETVKVKKSVQNIIISSFGLEFGRIFHDVCYHLPGIPRLQIYNCPRVDVFVLDYVFRNCLFLSNFETSGDAICHWCNDDFMFVFGRTISHLKYLRLGYSTHITSDTIINILKNNPQLEVFNINPDKNVNSMQLLTNCIKEYIESSSHNVKYNSLFYMEGDFCIERRYK
jgi:hypothetical protein